MWRGRQEHQRVGPGGQQASQTGTARNARLPCPGGHVVAFIDDDDVPPGVFQIVSVLQIALERINGDDAAVEMVERVVVRESKCVTFVMVKVLLGGYRAIGGLFLSEIMIAAV